METRTSEEILTALATHAPEIIGAAVIALSDNERVTLTKTVLPTREQLLAHNDLLSDPASPHYDPDLAS